MTRSYPDLASRAIQATPVPRLVAESRGPAVVLERIAFSGSTNWFLVRDSEDLVRLARRLSPGSCVSFYFDGRLSIGRYGLEARAALVQAALSDHNAVFGRIDPNGFEVHVDFPSSPREIDEFSAELEPQELALMGRFPGRDNDGTNAVTIDLPERDGVVRVHPH